MHHINLFTFPSPPEGPLISSKDTERRKRGADRQAADEEEGGFEAMMSLRIILPSRPSRPSLSPPSAPPPPYPPLKPLRSLRRRLMTRGCVICEGGRSGEGGGCGREGEGRGGKTEEDRSMDRSTILRECTAPILSVHSFHPTHTSLPPPPPPPCRPPCPWPCSWPCPPPCCRVRGRE
jgi:hypothetical protein